MEIELARVLLVDDDPTSRLTLQTVLEAGGYNVDAAASAAEAVGKLDDGEYELVLSDMQMESPESGLRVLAHAKSKDYRPATALVTTYHNSRLAPVRRLEINFSGNYVRATGVGEIAGEAPLYGPMSFPYATGSVHYDFPRLGRLALEVQRTYYIEQIVPGNNFGAKLLTIAWTRSF